MKKTDILLVDDEEVILRGMTTILLDLFKGHSDIRCASNGVHALRTISERPPNLLITDVCMPAMDGLELIKQVQRRYPDISLVIMSGHDDYQYMRAAIRYSVSDYLLKPVDRLELTQCVLRVRGNPPPREPVFPQECSDEEQIPGLIRDICLIVDEQLNRDITLQEIAEQMHYSYNYLSYLFKKKMNQSFVKYLVSRRIEKARSLLKGTHMRIGDIAACCGYKDISYFCRLFRRAEGITPQQYRNKNK